MEAIQYPHEVSTTGTRCTLVGSCLQCRLQRCFSDLVCQPLVTSYVNDASLFGHVGRLDSGVPAHDALRLLVDKKAGRQWIAGEDHRAALANLWLNKGQGGCQCYRPTAIYAVEILDRQGSRSVSTVHSDYATTTTTTTMMMDDRLVSKIQRKTNFARRLQAVRNRDC